LHSPLYVPANIQIPCISIGFKPQYFAHNESLVKTGK